MAAKSQGVGKEKDQGRIRVWSRVCFARLLGLASWATLSRISKNLFFFCKFNLAINFFKTETTVNFCDNFREIK